MRILLLASCVILAGCKPASDRCRQIDREASLNQIAEQTAARVEDESRALVLATTISGKVVDDTVRARLRRETLAWVTGDSAEIRPEPPPKPSDLAWYAEHCYRGRVR